jgi:hypothetical protein
MMGSNNYLATAPRIKDWEDFKDTIRKFEKGELNGQPGEISSEMKGQMEGFLNSLQNKSKKKSSGCMVMLTILLFVPAFIAYVLNIMV